MEIYHGILVAPSLLLKLMDEKRTFELPQFYEIDEFELFLLSYYHKYRAIITVHHIFHEKQIYFR